MITKRITRVMKMIPMEHFTAIRVDKVLFDIYNH